MIFWSSDNSASSPAVRPLDEVILVLAGFRGMVNMARLLVPVSGEEYVGKGASTGASGESK